MKIDFDKLLVKFRREVTFKQVGVGTVLSSLTAFGAMLPQWIRDPKTLNIETCLFTLVAVGLVHAAVGWIRATKDQKTKGFHTWDQRKSRTGGIVAAVNKALANGGASESDLMDQVKSLLQVMKMHVRDHLGNNSNDDVQVFATLLLLDGSKLVVCARDEDISPERKVGGEYDRSDLFVDRAIRNGEAVSIGHIKEFRKKDQSWKQKPYKDILAVPLIWSTGKKIGVVSFDSPTAYFFDEMEETLYTGLQPYLELLSLCLQHMSPDCDAEGPTQRLIEKSRSKAARRQAKVKGNAKKPVDVPPVPAVSMKEGTDDGHRG